MDCQNIYPPNSQQEMRQYKKCDLGTQRHTATGYLTGTTQRAMPTTAASVVLRGPLMKKIATTDSTKMMDIVSRRNNFS